MSRLFLLAAMIGAFALIAGSTAAGAAQLQILLPLGRVAYQTNEIIDVSVVRSDTQALAAGSLVMTVTGADGSKMSFTFPAPPAALNGASASDTENLHLDGYLLRPGHYTIDVTSDGADSTTAIDVYSSVRASTYKTVHWGGPSGAAMVAEGKDGMGYNVELSGDILHQEPSIAAGEDVMGVELMGGGHQFELKQYNDWSDPNVYLGADQVGLDRAFSFRTMPNAIGAHLHDEPGLTWLPNPHYVGANGQHISNDQDIPEQLAAYKRAFNRDAPNSWTVNPNDPDQFAKWTEFNDFKLGFMDAFWKSANDALSRLKPGYLAVTQSQYAWWALFDGYYFNVVRSMPVVSGHGGYNDGSTRNLFPLFTLEMAMPRNLDKPNWYLPGWGDDTSDEVRLEHNLVFATGIQGISSPPGMTVQSRGAAGTAETNRLYQKIGTIFTVPAYTNQPLALLYSKSNLYYQVSGVGTQSELAQQNLATVYLATELLHYPMQTIVEEDVLDGSLAADHKALIITGMKHMDAPVIAALSDYIKGGGTVLVTKDVPFEIPGATVLPIDPDGKYNQLFAAAASLTDKQASKDAMAKLSTFNYRLGVARPVADVLAPALIKAGIEPAFESSVPTIAAGHQVRGDIDYTFAVNFTVDPSDPPDYYGLGKAVATTAKISLPDADRPVYDMVTGQPVPFKDGVATLPFGPGQMYAFAQPVHPIGGVEVGGAVINRDYTRETDPLHVEITAVLMDTDHNLIAGNCPMEIKVTDPLGGVRYDVYRCAEHGVLETNLPLAANDPPGKWTVAVSELLSGKQGTSAFTYSPASQCGALAGRTVRSVVYGDDVPNIYSFFRDHRNVTIVAGSSPSDADAAQRLVDIFKPYDITATIESMADANQARPLTDEEAATWCGDGSEGQLTDAQRKDPRSVGYNLPGPTILVGNAADNPLIAELGARGVLPYKVTSTFPGAGHGMVAWNLMALGHDIETIALIGNDADGINEAVGTAFQIGIGVDPLTPYALPTSSTVTPATTASPAPVAAAAVTAH